MQGQQIEIKTDLLNMLEEAAINVTGVPIELIQNRQSPDYAMQLTMSSSKFLRFVYNRQTIFQKQMSKLYTKIYDLEYGSTDKLQLILPPPLFINMTNTNQLIQNATEYAENVIESFIPNEDDEVKAAAKQAVEENPKAVEDYHNGEKASLNFLMGQVMRLTKGKADPRETVKILKELLEE